MEEVLSYLIHNNSPERIELRGKIKEFTKEINIDLKEIYKQSNAKFINLDIKKKIKLVEINFYRN